MKTTPEHTQDTAKLALLIASPWGNLQGPMNDARLMEQELESRGFEIIQCYGDSATQRGILDAWASLITKLRDGKKGRCTEGPAVVIYYSGHGGLVQPSKDQDEGGRQYQFIVPSDFNQADDNFTGILDIEISHLLTRTTDETENVTVILDCCHSGRMARDPYHPHATPKAIPSASHPALRAHVEKLQETGQLQGDTYLNGNPFAVRVTASATAETAWEYENEEGLLVGALTQALVTALQETPVQDVSWRTTLLRVRELVNLEFPHQHPRVEGPNTRFLFSTKVSEAKSHSIKMQNGLPIIRAGRMAGVKEGNVYTVMPFGYEEPDDTSRLCRARAVHIDGVRSLVKLFEQTGPIPSEGALAFLDTKALHRWTVAYSKDNQAIHDRLEHSKYLRPHSPDDYEKPLIRIVQEDGALCAYDTDGTLLMSRPVSKDNHALAAREVVKGAERYARGHHLLTLQGGSGPEAFQHDLHITTGLVQSGQAVELPSDGNAVLTEGDRIYMALHNRGHHVVYVSVFDISPAGEICLISAQGETGIPIAPGQTSRIGESTFSILTGLGIFWPESIPRRGRLSETLVFIITSDPVDLRHLEDQGTGARGYDQDRSQLEFITHHLAVGGGRPVQPQRDLAPVQYDVIRFPFSLDSVAQG
ncbi:uncharacterized protein LTHEOB_779 [Lasiodiplodia theobromae]|uniref:uncharacterized protein n=1 Tax=Lasiodiplodia theobromae TaxID=45133 RepID=UPI0015C3F2DE|nr:uncharacterized protein LTHEOB_779 [Lasiodiplodia theobromae]KAF4540837.1 hypothetical protein LTHEOB_779 [Lasiodiplodia theobromae]